MGVVGVVILKFGAQLKFLLPALKFVLPFLKTGGTMLFTIWVYAMTYGWKFALGFVLLIFVHECGHLLAARYCGLNVGAPVFIPFMGAFIALKESPKNAWIEAIVSIGGPVLGTLGALACYAGAIVLQSPLLMALAHTAFFLNLFNLMPVGFLDGGRIVTAISPLLWILGLVLLLARLLTHFNFILLLILVSSLPGLFSLFRARTDEERRYYEVTPRQRWTMTVAYFGLAIFLALAMQLSLVEP